MGDKEKSKKYKTVFVQNVPISCTNEHLHEVYSVIGSIKEAFVVPLKPDDQHANSNQSLIGFVTYESPDDAQKAVGSRLGTFVIDSRKTKTSFARKKKFIRKKKDEVDSYNSMLKNVTKNHLASDEIADFGYEMIQVENVSKSENEENVKPSETVKNPESEISTIKTSSKVETCKAFKICITGFPDNFTIKDFVKIWKSKGFDLPEQFSITTNKAHQRQAFAEMSKKQAALKILTHLNQMSIEDKQLTATLNQTSEDVVKAAKNSRMIVRNLSFQCTEKDLRKVFSKYGNITEINIPSKEGKKNPGFAFVQLSHPFEAINAVKRVTMTEIKGRKVTVDLCLPRKEYQSIVQQEQSESNGNKQDTTEEVSSDDDGNLPPNDDDDDETSYHNESNDDDDISSSESDDDSIEDSKETKSKNNIKNERQSRDIDEGKTVFLRNLSFDVTEEELTNAMQEYGKTKYCLLVMNRETGFPKGTAFVQFLTKEEADNCVNKIEDPNTRLVLHGRQVISAVAQNPTKLKKDLKEKKQEKREKDKRNLYLATEGVIRPGTLAATGLSEIELKKRMRMEMAKRAKLKNPNVMVSTTRICFHNIPRNYDDQKLKKLIVDTLKDTKSVHVKECRLMCDRNKDEPTVLGRSRGFAFVNFSEHEHALLAIRRLNNNPDVFSAEKRPIIEFSLENRKALELKEKRRRKDEEIHAEKKRQAAAEAKAAAELKPAVKRKVDRIKRLREERREKAMLKKGVDAKPSAFKQTKKALAKVQDRKTFEGSSCVTSGDKKMRMTKRIGPKVRSRNKSQVLAQLRESKKLNKRAAKKRDNAEQEKAKPRAKDSNTIGFKKYKRLEKRTASRSATKDKDFDGLVAKYAKKIKTNFGATGLKPKWFAN